MFAELNSSINILPKGDDNTYEAPTVHLQDGGATVIADANTVAFELSAPAKVSVPTKKVHPMMVVYRISVPAEDAAAASEKDSYFNFIFDSVVAEAVKRYCASFGNKDEIRFGQTFCSFVRVDNSVFSETGDGDVEFRLYGNWASNIIVNTGETNDGQNN